MACDETEGKESVGGIEAARRFARPEDAREVFERGTVQEVSEEHDQGMREDEWRKERSVGLEWEAAKERFKKEGDSETGEWDGHTFERWEIPEVGNARWAFMNVRRFKRQGGIVNFQEDEMWGELASRAVDGFGGSDTGLEVGHGKASCYDTQYSSGKKARRAKRGWGGEHMRWTAAEGLVGDNNHGRRVGGTLMAVHERMKARLDDCVVDWRGWGRWAGRVIRGRQGKLIRRML